LDRNNIIDGEIKYAYLSFPSLKDTSAESHTAEIISSADYELFKKWEELTVKKRGEEYKKVKEKISLSMIEFVENKFPGFKEIIEYYELGTPLTFKHYCGHPLGGAYGVPALPSRFREDWIGPRTHIKNLYLTGADAGVHGIIGSMFGGYLSAVAANGLLKTALKIYQLIKDYRKM